MTKTTQATEGELKEFYQEADQRHLVPLCKVTARLLPFEPKSTVLPYLWKWSDLRRMAYRAGDLVPIERGGERRVLGLVNPGLVGKYAATHTGGPVLPTIGCYIQMIRPGIHTQGHRQVNSAVYHIFEGRGYSVINGTLLNWERGDFFVVPPWAWHEHANEGKEEAFLFSIQDTPVMEAPGLCREEAYRENGGRQKVTGTFKS